MSLFFGWQARREDVKAVGQPPWVMIVYASKLDPIRLFDILTIDLLLSLNVQTGLQQGAALPQAC
jgi:hypothetical protein